MLPEKKVGPQRFIHISKHLSIAISLSLALPSIHRLENRIGFARKQSRISDGIIASAYRQLVGWMKASDKPKQTTRENDANKLAHYSSVLVE